MRFRITLFLIASLSAVAAHGGMILRRSNGVEVSIEGNAYRLDLPTTSEPRAFDAVVSRNADATAAYINDRNRTWFERHPGIETHAAPEPFPSTTTMEKAPAVETKEEPGGTLAGHLTRKYTVHVRFDVVQSFRQNKVRLNIDATIVVWSAPDLPHVITPSLQTNFAAADGALAAALARIPGLPLREMTSVTRTYEGGQPFSKIDEWTTTAILPKRIADERFEVPKGFVHQFPQYSAPGR